MARYKDVEGYRKLFDEEYKKTRKLISEGETHLDNLAEGFSEASRVLDRIPTADVVPRADFADQKAIADMCAEVIARQDKEIEGLEQDVTRLEQEKDALIKNYSECMRDYARKIFADFTKHKVCTNEEDYRVLAELKKKYTGE